MSRSGVESELEFGRPLMPEQYPPPLTPLQLQYIQSTLIDYALSHGNIVRPQVPSSSVSAHNDASVIHAPCTLFPSIFPRKPFEEAREIMSLYNELYAKIAEDEAWLGSIVEDLSKVDDFIGNLWKCWKEAKKIGVLQDLSLGLFRSDYLIHMDPTSSDSDPIIHQVEFNTISSSFGALSTHTSQLHRHLYETGAYPAHPILKEPSLPPSSALKDLADGLALAHKAYGASVSSARQSGVMFLVQEGERNAFDQRWLEYSLFENHGIKVHRMPLDDVPYYTRLDEKTRALLYTPPYAKDRIEVEIEITTIYFRSGYGPADYPTPSHWEYRKSLELSRAIKCPTILTQLAGSKKIQQVLCNPGVVERFIASPLDARKIRKTFANIYPLDESSPEGIEARRLALDPKTAKRYVLKPQREGGGNNIYREKIPGLLRSIPQEAWDSYILMELIEPPQARNIIVRNGEVVNAELTARYSKEQLDIGSKQLVDYSIHVIGELGIYGVALWRRHNGDGKDKGIEILVNKEAGYLLRTKSRESEEGGVAAGYGCIDSVVLVE